MRRVSTGRPTGAAPGPPTHPASPACAESGQCPRCCAVSPTPGARRPQAQPRHHTAQRSLAAWGALVFLQEGGCQATRPRAAARVRLRGPGPEPGRAHHHQKPTQQPTISEWMPALPRRCPGTRVHTRTPETIRACTHVHTRYSGTLSCPHITEKNANQEHKENRYVANEVPSPTHQRASDATFCKCYEISRHSPAELRGVEGLGAGQEQTLLRGQPRQLVPIEASTSSRSCSKLTHVQKTHPPKTACDSNLTLLGVPAPPHDPGRGCRPRGLGSKNRHWATCRRAQKTRISPNFARMSCCSSRLENRILGFSPRMLAVSQGGASWLGLSLGSTSTSRFTWNKSGYFS